MPNQTLQDRKCNEIKSLMSLTSFYRPFVAVGKSCMNCLCIRLQERTVGGMAGRIAAV